MTAVGKPSPFGLHVSGAGARGTKVVDISPSLTGAATSAEAGTLSVSTSSVNQITPFMLPAQRRVLGKVALSVNQNLTGAAVFAQAEEVEGADTDLYILGAEITAGAGSITVPQEEIGTTVDNTKAKSDGFGRYEICEISGQKLYPGEAVRDWKGRLVSPRHCDPEPARESLKYPTVDKTGAKFSETEDTFISSSIAPEDL